MLIPSSVMMTGATGLLRATPNQTFVISMFSDVLPCTVDCVATAATASVVTDRGASRVFEVFARNCAAAGEMPSGCTVDAFSSGPFGRDVKLLALTYTTGPVCDPATVVRLPPDVDSK